MGMNAKRFGLVGAVVLLGAGGASGALAVPAEDLPRPVPSGAELSVRPGERVIVTTEAMRSGDAFSGVRVTSPAFAADGTFRMDDLLLKAVATVSCTTEPGSYEVRFGSPLGDENASKIDRLWGRIQVAPADAAERAECARQVGARPPESMEERYPAGSEWPSSPWDVRSVPAGGELHATDGLEMGHDGMVELTSPGFTGPVVMRGAKLVSATVRIRCDAQPGLYVVRWNEKGKPAKEWARYRVTPPAADCRDAASPPLAGGARPWAPWAYGAAAALAAAGLAAGLRLRYRRGRSA
ncbi:hypothetical protein OG429_23635 [Streptomyces sp. NBC_00190]|uniref:hypothetical protein n=1 Tax=Streptomyces sp. NBC_00190 TaxID=2903634 RepID=UPI002E29F21D|nr:hypothetical protein [Streptomyces sp. NBC_00190]